MRSEHFIIDWGMFVFSSLVVFTLHVLGPCTLGQGSRQPSRLDLLEIDEKLHLDEILVSLHSRCISAKQPLRSPQGESACISLMSIGPNANQLGSLANLMAMIEALVNIVRWCGFADVSENIGIRFHHDDGTLGILAPHRQGLE